LPTGKKKDRGQRNHRKEVAKMHVQQIARVVGKKKRTFEYWRSKSQGSRLAEKGKGTKTLPFLAGTLRNKSKRRSKMQFSKTKKKEGPINEQPRTKTKG